MKTIIINLVLTIVFLCPFYDGCSQDGSFKIITYNIWNGYDWGKDDERRCRVNEWINNQGPTIVALQELCKYTPEKLEEDAKSWGHSHSVLLKEDGYSVGLTSAYPIEVKEKIRDKMWHGALHCVTKGIDVFVIHLSPASYRFRQKEAGILLEKLKAVEEDQDRYIVLGDFNSKSPIDADLYDTDTESFARMVEKQKKKEEEGNLNHGKIDYSVMSAFMSLPLVDVCQSFTRGLNERGSFPGQVLGKINNETKEELITRQVRIDYIMASPILANKCISAGICNGKECYYLSDHYPVIAVFEK